MRWPILSALLLAQPIGAMTPADLQAARRWTVAIYERIPGPHFDWSHIALAPALHGLVDRDARFAQGEVGAIDGVPFCDCQDTANNYRIVRSSVSPRGSDGASVTIFLRNGALARFVVDIVRAPNGRFTVVDIHSRFTPSLLAYLRRAVPAEEKKRSR